MSVIVELSIADMVRKETTLGKFLFPKPHCSDVSHPCEKRMFHTVNITNLCAGVLEFTVLHVPRFS
jgi:hypothetical protein